MTDRRSEGSRTNEWDEVAMVMLSNFGRADGGRETWAYNFVPRLLKRHPALKLRIYGLRVDGEPDNSSTIREAVSATDRARLSVAFVRAARNRIPNALAFWRGLPALVRSVSAPTPSIVMAVGSFVELLAVLITPAFRSSKKIVWLRSIFAHEKAHRYPAVLHGLLVRIELSILRRADLIIANGEDTARHYRRFNLDITVVANAIDVDRWRMPPPRLKEPLQIAYIGRLAAVKGIREFLAATSMAHDEGALGQFSFHVVGDGDDLELAEIRKRGWIDYHGAIANDAVESFLAKTDVSVGLTFVASKAGELGGSGLSNAMLEQAASGRVMLCWDNAMYRQLLDERSCYFVPQGSTSELWRALKDIAADTAEAKARASEACARASQFGVDAHMERFDAAVDKLMGSIAPRSAA